MKNSIIVLFMVAVVLIASTAIAEIPQVITYMGQLNNSDGEPLTGDYQITFTVWNDPAASNPGTNRVWTSGERTVTVTDGLFSYDLGSAVQLPHDVATDTLRWLGIKVGADSEITPRTKLTSVFYSYHALRADSVLSIDGATFGEISGGAVIAGLVAGGMVEAGDFVLPPGAVTGYVLTSDANGQGTWQATSGGNNGWTDDGNTIRLNTDTDSIGIGTINPSAKVEVVDGDGDIALLGDDDAAMTGINKNGHYGQLGNDTVGVFGSCAVNNNYGYIGSENHAAFFKDGWGNTAYIGGYGMQVMQVNYTDAIEVNIGGNSFGVWAQTKPTMDFSGALVSPSDGGSGVSGSCYLSGITNGKLGTPEAGVFGSSTSEWAGYFDGDVVVESGLVGIGETSPTALLHLGGTPGLDGIKFPDGTLQTTAGDSKWTVADSILYTENYLGISKGGADNYYSGDSAQTIVNLGVACTTLGYYHTNINGGFANRIERAYYSTIGGGRRNKIDDLGGAQVSAGTVIAGGTLNYAYGPQATVGGGYIDSVIGDHSTVCGGAFNTARGQNAVICGGYENTIFATSAAIGGGKNNTVNSYYSAIGGGILNTIMGEGAYIGRYSVIGGGRSNYTDGEYSTIPGGDACSTFADHTFAAGRRAKALHDGCFVWADSTDADFSSTGPNQFLIRASGGVGIGDNSRDLYIKEVKKSDPEGYTDWISTDGIGIGNETGTNQSMLLLSDGSSLQQSLVFSTSTDGGSTWDPTFVIEQRGKVGIGTTGASKELTVEGDICYTGTCVACSDVRYKKDIEPIGGALETVSQLRGVTYNWRQSEFPDKKFDDQAHLGFVAQEINNLLPGVVMTDDDGYMSVDYGRITPVLVEAMKELKAENDKLRDRLTKIETLLERVVSNQ